MKIRTYLLFLLFYLPLLTACGQNNQISIASIRSYLEEQLNLNTTEAEVKTLQGYVEGEYVRLAAPFAGTLETLAVQRGGQVQQGAPAFTLEQQNETAIRQEATDHLHAVEARLADLKTGKRAAELNVIKSQLAQARTAASLSHTELQRVVKLTNARVLPKNQLDTARTSNQLNQERVRELEAQLQVAQQPARPATLKAVQAEVEAARATLKQAEWRLRQKSVKATRSGLVNDIYYQVGEWIAAGAPVISILPLKNRKVRFFVPEPILGSFQIGQIVKTKCDGCGEPFSLTINYIAPQAEYTPPVIYSKDSREKLVIMVEAIPTAKDALRLKVGQPVDVVMP